jgi:hypothetical protein
MTVKKRKAPKKERGRLLAAALQGRGALQAFNKDESARYEHGRIKFLEALAAELGLQREKFRSDGEWLYELAFRLACDQYASTGDRGRPTDSLTEDDFMLWHEWQGEKRKAPNARDREIAENLVERLSPWKEDWEAEKSPVTGEIALGVKRKIAEKLRGRYRTIKPKIKS